MYHAKNTGVGLRCGTEGFPSIEQSIALVAHLLNISLCQSGI